MPRPIDNKGTYLPALDGLRAIAVAAVVAYHLGSDAVPGGLRAGSELRTVEQYLGCEDTLLLVLSNGVPIAFDDDSGPSSCSFLAYTLPAGTTVYAHVIDFGDDSAIASYGLAISFP